MSKPEPPTKTRNKIATPIYKFDNRPHYFDKPYSNERPRLQSPQLAAFYKEMRQRGEMI